MLINPLNKLLPNTYTNPPLINQQDQGVNSLAALTGSQDATGSDTNAKLMQLAGQTPLLDQLKIHLMSGFPNPANYQPNKRQQILGALSGLGAGTGPATYHGGAALGFKYDPVMAKAGEDLITEGPYQKALQNYDLRAKMLEGGANIEEKQFANQRMLEQTKALNEIRQQNADTAAKKEQDIHDQKINELAARVTKSENDLEEKKREFEGKQANFQQLNDLKQAEFKIVEARHALELAQKDKEFQAKLSETSAQHDAQKAKWDADIANAQERARIAEEAVKARPGATGTETVQEVKKPGINIFGYHPFESTDKITTTTKQPITPNQPYVIPPTKGYTPPNQNNINATAVIRQKAVDYLKAHGKAMNENNIQKLVAVPESEWP